MLGPLAFGLLCLATAAAHANGRLPAATGLAMHPTDEQQLLLGLTYGLALSRNGGASWTWICEAQIEGNGSTVDPVVVMTGDGTLVVLSLTTRSVLVSRDDGCTFERTMGPLQGNRGVDLTLDPSRPGRVLALMSSVVDATDAGPRFRNLVAHSLDHASTWEVLAELPEDILPETLEVAPSDVNRIYVTGVATSDQLEGIVLRSDDGGLSWSRITVRLPQGSGSMFLSAIHPEDPDRLWVRVPGRGDSFGVLPAELWQSADGGASFDPVGETTGGMLGFALSPDGNRVAFGGPLDGLFLVPADASATPSKISEMPVSCLRWRESGLYACALETTERFGLGLAAEPTTLGFDTLWQRAGSCRPACAPPSLLEMRCRDPWEQLAPVIDAGTPLCDGSSPPLDAGIDAGAEAGDPGLDGGDVVVDASDAAPEPTRPRARSASGCTVTFLAGVSTPGRLISALLLAGWMRRVRARLAAQGHGASNRS
jgi:hypothetical protein